MATQTSEAGLVLTTFKILDVTNRHHLRRTGCHNLARVFGRGGPAMLKYYGRMDWLELLAVLAIAGALIVLSTALSVIWTT